MAAGQQNPRLVAVQVLTRCEDGGYVDAALDAALQKSGLPAIFPVVSYGWKMKLY